MAQPKNGFRAGPGLVALLALASCYSYVGRYTSEDGRQTLGETPYTDFGGNHWYVEIPALNVDRRETYADDLFSCPPAEPVVAARTSLRPIDRPGQARSVRVDDAAASAGALVFRVGLMSDVHIRQPAVKLFNDDVSRTLDAVINSFERNGYQEAFQNAVYAATVSAFNQLASPDDKPRLIINTGDATDSGTIEEAYDFAAITYHLRYPLLYALGNHDDAIFGNYKSEIGYTKNAGPAFYPVGQKDRFLMYFNRRGRTIVGFSDKLVPLPLDPLRRQFDFRWGALDIPREASGVEPLDPPNACPLGGAPCRHSQCYGMDLYGPPNQPCDTYPGYYSAMFTGADGSKVQLIALNTTREKTWGQWAAFEADQLNWLAQELRRPADVTVVFMHHRPSDSALSDLSAKLRETAAQRPLVALTAHEHSFKTEWQGFWELNAGSLEEFPQWARLIEIRRDTEGHFFVNARSLRPQLPVLAVPPDLTNLGVPAGRSPDEWDMLPVAVKLRVDRWMKKQFAACDVVAQQPSNQCRSGDAAHNLLIESAQCGYLGAIYDRVFRWPGSLNPPPKASPPPPRPQSALADAFAEANVVVDISAPPRRTP